MILDEPSLNAESLDNFVIVDECGRLRKLLSVTDGAGGGGGGGKFGGGR